MDVQSLPDRPLTMAECDELRQKDRITKLASAPMESGEVGLLFMLLNDVFMVLSYDSGILRWQVKARHAPVTPDDFEAAVKDAGKELGISVRERDRSGVERDLS